ncbi:MAG: poly-gamma-glutamate system protein [Clostridium sp.]|nr:poly-gamma-glutamate system protein [Clostridium sp.]
MNRPYFRRPPRLMVLAILFLYLVFSVLTLEHTRYYSEKPHAELMRDAARRTEACFGALKEARIAAGYPLDPIADPNATGMVGLEFTEITTSLGNLEAKRSTANPNCGAMIADYLLQAGVQAGDTVCLNLSSSFPSLNVAALCALDAIGARGISINSVGASSYGGNLPEFGYMDMEQVLLEQGLIKNHTGWVSLGGSRDLGIDMLDIGMAEAIAKRAEEHGAVRLSFDSVEKSLEARREIYLAEAGGAGQIRCFINIGGNVFAFFGSDNLIDAPNGLIKKPFPNMEHRGLIPWFLDQGIPVIHLLEMKSLLPSAGLPFDPVPMPKAGEGDVYYELRYRKGPACALAAGFAVLFFLLIFRKKP